MRFRKFRLSSVFAPLVLAGACALPASVFARSLVEAGAASEWRFLTDDTPWYRNSTTASPAPAP